jgi:hypothetical protein
MPPARCSELEIDVVNWKKNEKNRAVENWKKNVVNWKKNVVNWNHTVEK